MTTTINMHPNRLTSSDIAAAFELSELLRPQSGRFANWLISFLQSEVERRETGDLIEPALARVNCCDWTNSEIADALIAATTALQVIDRPALREFLQQSHFLITLWASNRLRNTDSQS